MSDSRHTRQFGFCTNAFPAMDLDNLIQEQLPRFKRCHTPLNDERLALDLQLGTGIIEELPTRGAELVHALNSHGLKVGSLNLFPLCDFQAEVVKTSVYAPNWLQEERHRLTMIGAEWVARDLKPQSPFCISTLAGRYHEDGQVDFEDYLRVAEAVQHFAERLAQLKTDSGCHITLCLEPEPFTTLQKIQDVVNLWDHFDSPASKEHVGINLDCCHFSVMGETPLEAWNTFKAHGIPTPKIHASTALSLKGPLQPKQIEFLKTMNEPRFLHQCTLVRGDDREHLNDLDLALEDSLDDVDALHCHFHMPLFLKDPSPLFHTTEGDTDACLKVIDDDNVDIYAETYTWSVLGTQFADGPEDGIIKELQYLQRSLFN